MKLIIEITEEEYNECKENYQLCEQYGVRPKAYDRMIANGTVVNSDTVKVDKEK